MDCIFCDIATGKIPSYKVYEDSNFTAFMDINPLVIGHTLLIPKTHVRNIFDTPEDICRVYYSAVKKIAKAVQIAFRADGINIVQSNESAAGQAVFHAHIHIIPRFDDDGLQLGSTDRLKLSAAVLRNSAEKIVSIIK